MDAAVLTSIAIAIVLYGVVSARAQRSFITPPMAFATLGFLIGPAAFGWLRGEPESTGIHILAELTLVVVLFTDASRINLPLLWREHKFPVRLLIIGLPLTIALGTLAAIGLFPDFSIWQAALLAAIVAPTDASLAHPVVTNKLVPVRIRQTISVESGLNDGLCVPLILLFLCGTKATGHNADPSYWFQFAALQVTLGPAVGVFVGYLGSRLLNTAIERKWTDDSFVDLAALGLAGAAYGTAELIGGNGFIATFVCGLTVSQYAPSVCKKIYEFGEAEGQLLTLMTFLVVGALMAPLVLAQATIPVVLFAVLSLTLLRMIPVAISLLGTGLHVNTLLFVGWFGPRGTASIVFALMLLQDSSIPRGDEIFLIAMTTVLISLFAHGLSAVPAARWYGKRIQLTESATDVPEHSPIDELPFCCREAANSVTISKG